MSRARIWAPSERAWFVARTVIGIGSCIGVLLPLLYVLRISVEKPSGRLESELTVPTRLGPSAGFSLHNFVQAWRTSGVGHAFRVSLLAVGCGSLIATAVATLAGFGYAKLAIPGRRVLVGVLAFALAIPPPVIALPLISQGVSLGYTNKPLGLGLVYGALFSVFGTLFMASYYADFPDAILEAAQLDGCSRWRAFRSIVVPLSAPAVATLFVLNVLVQWGELILALVILPSQQTVPVAIAGLQNAYDSGGPTLAAAAIVAALPVIAVACIAQRFLRAGLRAGAVKL